MPSYLGQNFLTDSTYTIFIAKKVADFCDRYGLQQCIEIGPGKGALTKKLVSMVDRPLLLLEKDETLLATLEPNLASVVNRSKVEREKTERVGKSSGNNSWQILLGDALQLDVASQLKGMGRNTSKTIVVGNLPYYITSPLLTKFFGGGNAQFPVGVFMVQKEVADKIKTDAEKKSYLWRLLNYQYEVTYLKTVPAKAFTPVPKVQSAVFSLVDRALMANTNVSLDSQEIVDKQTDGVLSKNISFGGKDSETKPSFSYQEMVGLLDKISMYKRKTLGKCWKMANLQGVYTLPEDLAGKRLEEIGLEEMERILS